MAARGGKKLTKFVKTNGHKWRAAGKLFGRSALNVKDKWKQLGGDHSATCKKGPWTAREITALVRLVHSNCSVSVIKKKTLFECEQLSGEKEAIARLAPSYRHATFQK